MQGSVAKWNFGIRKRIWRAGCHQGVATKFAFLLTRSFDEELHVVHTWSLEPSAVTASLAIAAEATGTLLKGYCRTLKQSQSQLDHNPLLVGPDLGPHSYHSAPRAPNQAIRCGNLCWMSWSVEEGCIRKKRGHSCLRYFHWRCSQRWDCV